MSHGRRRLLLALLAPLCGCVARLGDGPPRRVHRLERPIDVRLVSQPPGLAVFALDDHGRPGERLGTTPLVLDRLELAKELWKHGIRVPPAEPGPELERAGGARGGERAATGTTLRYDVAIEREAGRPPESLRFEIDALAFERGFDAGLIVLDAGPAGAAPAAGEAAP